MKGFARISAAASSLERCPRRLETRCFRCHGSDKVDESGNTITKDCTACHTIVAQGPSESLNDLDQNLTGLEFVHPVDIGDTWQEINCTGCHTPEQGY